MDAFSQFGLPPKLVLEMAVLDEKFNAQGKIAHPDAGGTAEEFEKIRSAYEVLKSPARRIRSVLGPEEDRGSVPGEVMDLFGPIADSLARLDDFLKERAAARSSLGKAVLDARMPALKAEVENLADQLRELEARFVARFAEFDTRGWDACASEMGEVARGLVFIEKWSGQLRGATGKLFEALLGGMS